MSWVNAKMQFIIIIIIQSHLYYCEYCIKLFYLITSD